MATIDVKDASGATVAIEKPLTPGRVAAASSRPVTLSTEDFARLLALQFNDENSNPVQWGLASPIYPAVPATPWYYVAPASGMVATTTALPIAAAAGASLRNYLTSMTISTDTAMATPTEIVVRDGAGGTVIWRSKIGAAGWINGREIIFAIPRRSTVNSLLEVCLLTSSATGAVYFNADGFVAA